MPKKSRTYFRDYIHSHGGMRVIQYNFDDEELLIVGEEAHGLDYYKINDAPSRFWWCSMSIGYVSPRLILLMKENQNRNRPTFRIGGDYDNPDKYLVLELHPLPSHKIYATVPDNDGNTMWPDAYNQLLPCDGEKGNNFRYFVYYKIDHGGLNIAVMHTDTEGINGAADGTGVGSHPNYQGGGYGEGEYPHDNGVRIHIAFKAEVPLNDDIKKLLQDPLTLRARPYSHTPPHGF